ncbi:MAG: tRNA (guanosine(37)-N1)-methyltransferase TrmD [Oligoflexia bacterium]|nr:tRNA (guanosine(37)-N1)-methyltransferase TrmD [Oligoflexia bacterium]
MKFDVLSLFPEMIYGAFREGIVAQALKEEKIALKVWNPRDQSQDVHKTVDDRPFGGGDGMVMLPEILNKTLSQIPREKSSRVIYLSPQGQKLSHQKVLELKEYQQLVLICGRYGGIDERFIESFVDEELSVGDYVVSGGEIPAMIVIDAVSRQIPGVLGNKDSAAIESFSGGLLEHPQYTRPQSWNGKEVPQVLLSGHHEKIETWKRESQLSRTLERRPDLLVGRDLKKPEFEKACEDLGLRHRIAVGLVHYPVYNKGGEVVSTNVTNLDIHDIARACRSYGIDRYYIITPAEEQLSFVGRVLEHWQEGRGIQYNPTRKDSLINVRLARSFEEAYLDWGEKDALKVATSARQISGPKPVRFPQLREIALKKPVFLLFGTGWGLENTFVRSMDLLLEPVWGRSPQGFRHLSVRSAVSIVLDRLFGSCY